MAKVKIINKRLAPTMVQNSYIIFTADDDDHNKVEDLVALLEKSIKNEVIKINKTLYKSFCSS